MSEALTVEVARRIAGAMIGMWCVGWKGGAVVR